MSNARESITSESKRSIFFFEKKKRPGTDTRPREGAVLVQCARYKKCNECGDKSFVSYVRWPLQERASMSLVGSLAKKGEGGSVKPYFIRL